MFSTPRTRPRRRDRDPSVLRQVLLGGAVFLTIGLLLSAVWYVARLPSLTIDDINITGGETVEHRMIEVKIEEVLRGEYLHLVPHRFIFSYPHDAILSALGTFDRIENIELVREGQTLVVSFTEYRPYALWCMEHTDSAPCYFLTDTGYAFGPSPMLQGGTLIRHVIDGETQLSERQVFNEADFKKMHAFLRTLSDELDLRITDVEYTQVGDIKLSINGGGMVYMRNDSQYETTLNNIRTIITSDDFKHLRPGNFQYIDVRFGNKIFVNEEPLPVDVGTTTETGATST